jgi:chromosome partitioning protein
MPTIAFFNNKGGVGKTSLVFHLSWMFRQLGHTVLAVDLDPQANLTNMFFDDESLESLWPVDAAHEETIYKSLRRLVRGLGDVAEPTVHEIVPGLGVVAGDLELARFEDQLSGDWPRCLDRNESAFRTTTAFSRAIGRAQLLSEAHWVLVDVGPNLGAINRSALIACDYIVVPLAPDLFSIQGLRNLGPTLTNWRGEWSERRERAPADMGFVPPEGRMQPLGYVVMQYAIKASDSPVKAYTKWMARIPGEYATSVAGTAIRAGDNPANDTNCLALLKHYRSLVPMAMEARKPIFNLKSSDGAIGSHLYAVEAAKDDFTRLAKKIITRVSQREAQE